MTYTCACYPHARRLARRGAGEQVPAGVREAAAEARRPAARRRVRLGRHGALRGPPRRPRPRRDAVARADDVGAARHRRRGARRPGRGALRRLPRHPRGRLRRGVVDRAARAHRRAQLPVVLRASCSRGCAPAGCCSTTASPGPTTRRDPSTRGFIDRYVFPDGELTGSGRIITEAQDVGLEVLHEENLRPHYALTLRDWCANLVEHWDEAVAEVGLADREGVGPVHGRVAARVRGRRDPAAPGARGAARRARRRRRPAAAAWWTP